MVETLLKFGADANDARAVETFGAFLLCSSPLGYGAFVTMPLGCHALGYHAVVTAPWKPSGRSCSAPPRSGTAPSSPIFAVRSHISRFMT